MRMFPDPSAVAVAACFMLLGSVLSQVQVPLVQTEPVRQVAVIGAGAAGSATAYYLRKYTKESGISVNITIFEKTDRIGGRTLTVNPFGDTSQRLELGASIFIQKNCILYDSLAEFGLRPRDPDEDSDSTLGIWDGDEFVFTIDQKNSFWWNAYKVIRKYGVLAPRRTQKLVDSTIDRFLQLYEAPHFPFKSLTQRVYELDLVKATGVTGEQFLKTNNIGDSYAHDIIQTSTRVNYASNLALIHGLDAMVSMAPQGAMAVEGGNWQIFHEMVQHSGAHVALNTSVVSIGLDDTDDTLGRPRYTLKTSSPSVSDKEEVYSTLFDDVVIATPYQFSKIAAEDGVVRQVIDEIPYVELHVTLLASPFRYDPKFFGMAAGKSVPGSVLTTLAKDDTPTSGVQGVGKAGFFSISTLRKSVNPNTKREEYLYKIFSPEKVTPELLSRLFGVQVPDTFVSEGDSDAQASPISWYYPHVFNSYPRALPRVTFQDPIVGPNLYYTSGMESFISTMETNALMGKNVARLIFDDIMGVPEGLLKIECDRGRNRVEVPKTRPTEETWISAIQDNRVDISMLGRDGILNESMFECVRANRTSSNFHTQVLPKTCLGALAATPGSASLQTRAPLFAVFIYILSHRIFNYRSLRNNLLFKVWSLLQAIDNSMFVLRNVGKLIFGSSNQETLIELPQGQLYLVRPLSPKGYSELIFKDSSARIRRTAQDFQYQLVVQRVYEEGEAELLDEEGEDGEADADLLAAERDERTFLLDEALHFRVENREGSEKVLAWRDLSGDAGDVYEFVCDTSILPSQVDQFELAARQCQYERKYRKPHTTASDEDLVQFVFDDEQPIPQASPLHSPTLTRSIESSDSMFGVKHIANTGAKREKLLEPESETELDATPTKKGKENVMGPPKVVSAHPEAREILAAEVAELHFFDFPAGAFVLQDASVTATVTEIGNWQYWLQVGSADRDWLGIPVVGDMNPVFNFEFLSFIFNQFSDDGSAYSWLLRFKDQAALERFQAGLLQALWEQLNEMKWSKIKDKERDYVADAFNDMTLNENDELEPVHEEEEEEEEEVEDDRALSEHYDSDEEEDDVDFKPKDGEVNKQIAVGYKHDRSFVVRGSKIGVFKHTPKNHLEFSTNISKVETPKGELFSPKKVMLHNEDRNLILQKDSDPNTLYRMDLEYGKVVDEWKVHDDIPVVTFAPENKFAQMTHEPTFLGVSHNALYRVDPRLSGSKLVDAQLKQYASKNDFSAIATTEKGYIAVASNKGDVRLFDRLGINAKTHIPALGEAIIGLDVSADGRWVLATCRTYLLLVDALQTSGKNEGKLGFEKSFAADAKPQPRRLALQPEHIAQFYHETSKGINFTPAKFNTGAGAEETSIITATGPYIIEWSLKKVLAGKKAPYLIKRYTDDVKADDFKFGTDKNVIVALPHEVNMVDHARLKRPNRESIAGDFGAATGRRSSGRIGTRDSGRYKLGKDDVVKSVY
ncbi:VID27 cytoplasmic protein-domain-containing protein [Apodospora peruviana]|uniref:VID27 cytoplasmic protein-domain-containing protein n=1 Tax=Apodospora peruviana TaxID=516989 RepID=A0AAE0HUK8_9PEZI|nr:VID27 cytoplasmic protein-domain-containing protein [Apodospora peruviana]